MTRSIVVVVVAAFSAMLLAGCTTSSEPTTPETSATSPFKPPLSELPDDLPSPPQPFASRLGNHGQGGLFAHAYLVPFGMDPVQASETLFDHYASLMPDSGWSQSDLSGKRGDDWRLLWDREEQLVSVSFETDLGDPYLLVEACPPFRDGFCNNE